MRRNGKDNPLVVRKVLEARRRSRAVRHPLVFGSELLRQRLETLDDRRRLADLRDGSDICSAEDEETNPLVTIRIATYNRGQLIVDRALASAMAQSYSNIEILVVGDHCDEVTEKAVLSVDDPRVHFVNLPERGRYPTDPVYRWMVAGTVPMNAALALAAGSWIAPCDDDDELTEDHVEVLLKEALARRLESRVEFRTTRGESGRLEDRWQRIVPPGIVHARLCPLLLQASVLPSQRFKLEADAARRLGSVVEDTHRVGVKMGFLNHVTYVHYRKHNGEFTPSLHR